MQEVATKKWRSSGVVSGGSWHNGFKIVRDSGGGCHNLLRSYGIFYCAGGFATSGYSSFAIDSVGGCYISVQLVLDRRYWWGGVPKYVWRSHGLHDRGGRTLSDGVDCSTGAGRPSLWPGGHTRVACAPKPSGVLLSSLGVAVVGRLMW